MSTLAGKSPSSRLARGWVVQVRVVKALMIRELITRFGRENFGFLWMMVEPMLFAGLVGIMWTFMRGPTEQGGFTTAAFVASGYIPLTLFRHAVGQANRAFSANSALMYHRQISLLDFILARFVIEVVGAMMAFLVLGTLLIATDLMPVPVYPIYLLGGWGLYCLFCLPIMLIMAPLSERADWIEKLIPVTLYVSLPFSGAFTMNSWLTPKAAALLIYSPFVDCMEMIRYGIFGDAVTPIYNPWVPVYAAVPMLVLGLVLCRRARAKMVFE